jgi:hypothetical protein
VEKVRRGKMGRWEDGMWKVEGLKSWKRDKMKERGEQGERMIWRREINKRRE